VLWGFGTGAKLPSSPLDILSSITLVRFSEGDPPLAVAWTLFHELAFYTLFGVLILSVRAGIALFALWGIACILFFHQPGDAGVGPASVYTAASNLYFLFGMGAYWVYRRGGSGLAEVLGGVALLAAAFIALPVHYAIARLVLVLGFALLLAGVTKLELSGRLAFPRWAIYVGDASYSLYLLHESLAGLLLKVLMKTHVADALGRGLTYLVVLGLTVPLGCLAYATIEKPLLHALRRRKPRVTAAALTGDQRA
jgi:exopolysaccharide production protein ExoZ